MFKMISLIAAVGTMAVPGVAAAALAPSGDILLTVESSLSPPATPIYCSNVFDAVVGGSSIVVATNSQALGTTGFCALTMLTSGWTLTTGAYSGGGWAPLTLTGFNVASPIGTCTQAGTPIVGVWYNGTPGYGELSGTVAGMAFGFPTACVLELYLQPNPNVVAS